jgi:DNA anti-recombination protein RmuC
MDISKFLPAFYPLLPILPLAIIVCGILAILLEFNAFVTYGKDCKSTKRIIDKLENSRKDSKINNLSGAEIKWLHRHIDGTPQKQQDSWTFESKRENHCYLILEYPAILRNAVPHSPVGYAPTALIASGVFSTFLGISQGAAGGGSDNLEKAGQVLFSSLKHVFFTSLLGLAFATFLIILIAVLSKNKERQRNKLRARINDIAIVLTTEKLLLQMNSSSSDNAIQGLTNAANSLSTLSSEAIGIAVAKAIAADNKVLLEEIKQLRHIQEKQGQTVEVLLTELEQRFIQPVVQRLAESALLTKDASEAVRELKNELGEISQNLAGAVITIQSFQQQTLQDLQKFANSLDSTLQSFQNETKGVLEQVGTEINKSVAHSIHGMKVQRAAFEESAMQVSTTFRGIREDLQSALTTQSIAQREMLDAITSQTTEILKEANFAFQSQSTTLENLMNTAKDNLNSTLSNIDTTLQNTRQTVQNELENFRVEYQSSLNTFFDQQNNLLNETLGKQREGLSEVVSSLQKTFNDEAEKRQQMSQQVDKSMQNVLNTTQKVSNLANVLGLSSSERLGELQELSRTIGGEAHRVEKAYQSMTDQFEKALVQGNEELARYLDKANESYVGYFTAFDSATTKVYKELNNTSGELLKAAQYLVVAVDHQDRVENN